MRDFHRIVSDAGRDEFPFKRNIARAVGIDIPPVDTDFSIASIDDRTGVLINASPSQDNIAFGGRDILTANLQYRPVYLNRGTLGGDILRERQGPAV